MFEHRLFPRMPAPYRRRLSTRRSGPAPWSASEIGAIRSALVTTRSRVSCPRCAERMRCTEPTVRDDRVSWRVHCLRCSLHAVVQAGPPVRGPRLRNLIASAPKRSRVAGTTRFACSAAAHGMVIWAAVMATGGGHAEFGAELARDTTLIYLAPPTTDVSSPAMPPPVSRSVVRLANPARGFQTVVPVPDLPFGIPEVDLTERFDPRDYSGRGAEGGFFGGMGAADEADSFAGAFDVLTVDERPEHLAGPALRYPSHLRDAGIEGHVVIEFVVDTLGRAERPTIRVIDSSNRGFEAPALEMIRGSRYRPGRVLGRRVRVLAQMRIEFTIGTASP